MRLGARQIGPDATVYVIAEIGVNHDGCPRRAVELVEAAADAGADSVKFQVFRAELLMSRAAALAAYQSGAGETDPLDMLRRLELPFDALGSVCGRARELGVDPILTVFSPDLVEPASRLAPVAWKTASPDIINKPLLDALSSDGRPLIVSTGAATMGEVERTLGWLGHAADHLALLQCVSAYPTPDEEAALDGIEALASIAPGPVGYSDHTNAIDTGARAVARGASIIEKHFTHDRSAVGPDHAASLEPSQLAEYVRLARAADWGSARTGRGRKAPLQVELDVRDVSRQSLVARVYLPAGTVLTRDALTIKRPGRGVEPWRLDDVVGRTLARAVDADTPLTANDLA